MKITSISNVQYATRINSQKNRQNITFGDKGPFVDTADELKFYEQAHARTADLMAKMGTEEELLKECKRLNIAVAGQAALKGHEYTADQAIKESKNFEINLRQVEARNRTELPKHQATLDLYSSHIAKLRTKLKAEKLEIAMQKAEKFLAESKIGKALKAIKLGGLVRKLFTRGLK